MFTAADCTRMPSFLFFLSIYTNFTNDGQMLAALKRDIDVLKSEAGEPSERSIITSTTAQQFESLRQDPCMLDTPAVQLSFGDVYTGGAAGELQRQAGELLASASTEKKELQSALKKLQAKLENSKVEFVRAPARANSIFAAARLRGALRRPSKKSTKRMAGH